MVDHADPVYHKTDAGHDEIKTRQRRLDHKLRALLLIINGERSRQDLLAQVGGMGVGPEAFGALLELGLIEPVAAQVPAPAASVAPPASAQPSPQLSQDTNTGADKDNLFSLYAMRRVDLSPDRAAAASAPPPPVSPAPAGANAYQQLYHFYTDVIGHHLGLRGYVMQVKVEKAVTLLELAGLRDALHAALQKAKGEITADAIVAQLDGLMASLGVVPAR